MSEPSVRRDGPGAGGEPAGPGAPGAAPTAGTLVGIGLDSVDVHRFATLLVRRATMRSRLFTEHERAYAAGLANPFPSLAARFAAKEAVMKSLGVGLGALDWWDVEVRRASTGAPVLAITGRAAELAVRRRVNTWQLSLTHTDAMASAIVAALA